MAQRDHRKSTRAIGDALEEHVLETLPNTTKTKGSGSVRGDGDIHHPVYMVECKTKYGSDGISITKLELRKGMQQALKVQLKPMFVMKNGLGQILACIPYRDMVNLLYTEDEEENA